MSIKRSGWSRRNVLNSADYLAARLVHLSDETDELNQGLCCLTTVVVGRSSSGEPAAGLHKTWHASQTKYVPCTCTLSDSSWSLSLFYSVEDERWLLEGRSYMDTTSGFGKRKNAVHLILKYMEHSATLVILPVLTARGRGYCTQISLISLSFNANQTKFIWNYRWQHH